MYRVFESPAQESGQHCNSARDDETQKMRAGNGN